MIEGNSKAAVANFSNIDIALACIAGAATLASHIWFGDVITKWFVEGENYFVLLREQPETPRNVSGFSYYITLYAKYMIFGVGIYLAIKALFLFLRKDA